MVKPMKGDDIETVAILTVYHAPDFSKRGRQRVANWLDKQKELVLDYSQELDNRYRARYLSKKKLMR